MHRCTDSIVYPHDLENAVSSNLDSHSYPGTSSYPGTLTLPLLPSPCLTLPFHCALAVSLPTTPPKSPISSGASTEVRCAAHALCHALGYAEPCCASHPSMSFPYLACPPPGSLDHKCSPCMLSLTFTARMLACSPQMLSTCSPSPLVPPTCYPLVFSPHSLLSPPPSSPPSLIVAFARTHMVALDTIPMRSLTPRGPMRSLTPRGPTPSP